MSSQRSQGRFRCMSDAKARRIVHYVQELKKEQQTVNCAHLARVFGMSRTAIRNFLVKEKLFEPQGRGSCPDGLRGW